MGNRKGNKVKLTSEEAEQKYKKQVDSIETTIIETQQKLNELYKKRHEIYSEIISYI